MRKFTYLLLAISVLLGSCTQQAPQRVSSQTDEFWEKHAIDVIQSVYGDTVYVKPKTLNKFGQNDDADQDELTTVMQLQGSEIQETLPTTNVINRLSSSNNSDTFVAGWEGHDCTGGVPDNFYTGTTTLTGQTGAPITLTPGGTTIELCRISRLNNSSGTAQQTSSTIYGYQSTSAISNGVPSDNTKIHVVMVQAKGDNTSLKAATSFSSSDYGLITSAYFAVDKKTAAKVDFKIQVRQPGGVFRTIFSPISLNTASQSQTSVTFRPFLIVPKSSDIRIVALSNADNTSVSAGFNALIALVTD